MKSNHWFSVLAVGVLLLAGWAFPMTATAETVIKIGGTGSALGTMKLLTEAYEKTRPGVRVQILPSLGSTGGIKAALAGGIDLALSSRPLTDSERQPGVIESEYARSPFIFITNPKIGKKEISTRELVDIYSKPTTNWPDGSRVRLVLRPEKDLDTKIVRSISPAMDQAVKSAMARPGMIMAITDQESTDVIVKTPGAFGASTLCETLSENRTVNILSFNGVQPSVKNITNKTYPLFKPFYVVTTPKSSAEARQFSEFLLSPAAGKILLKSGNMVVKVK
jgi:phosphate transport system substrate-binding protein